MFRQADKTIDRMRPLLRRVLIVDPQPSTARMLGELVRQVSHPDIWAAGTHDKALALAAKVDPQAIFCELASDGIDGGAFTRSLRRSDLACRQAPVILVAQNPTAAAILAARDAGAHEFLRRPFTTRDLLRRLEAVTLHPRDWVEAMDYVGPDRRRFNSAEFPGPLQRTADRSGTPEAVRIGQALKILRSAAGAVDKDPAQATRALLAQSAELEVAAELAGDSRLATAARDLHRYVFEAVSGGRPIDCAETERRAAPLLAHFPRHVHVAA